MKKYSIEEKQRAVEMVKEGQSVRTVSRQTGISRKVLEYVLAQVDKHGWSSLEGHRYNWSAEEKLSILQYMENNHLSCFETGIHFGIKGSSTVRVWAERYRRDGMAGLESKKQGRPKKWRPPDETMTREEQLEAENLYLRAENAYLKKLRALIAEEERQERERKQQSSRN
jgi:transposase